MLESPDDGAQHVWDLCITEKTTVIQDVRAIVQEKKSLVVIENES